jgi:hypothetical protein
MIPKGGHRFSEKIMLQQKSMIPKGGHRFSEKIMLEQIALSAALSCSSLLCCHSGRCER